MIIALKSWLFQASLRNCLNCVQNCYDHSLLDLTNPQFNVWIISYITSHSFLTAGSLEPTNDQLLTSVGSHSHLVRALHQYREVTGSNLVGVLTFSGFSTQLLKCVQNCDDHIAYLISNPHFNIWNIPYIASHCMIFVFLTQRFHVLFTLTWLLYLFFWSSCCRLHIHSDKPSTLLITTLDFSSLCKLTVVFFGLEF